MKKSGTITLVVVIGVIVIIAGWVMGAYNSLVSNEEAVNSAWSQVENVYQRRSDLIPNLVATVKGYAEHESSTLEGVVEARSKATAVNVDPSNLSPEAIAKFQQAQGELSSALGRLMMIKEAYPDLKANENFKDLQAQLEGTENRIATERKRYNEEARNFNVTVRRFPNNIIANMFNFRTKGYFESEEGANKAPKVEF